MKRIFLTAIAIAASSFLFSVSLQAQIRGITQSKKTTNVKSLQFPVENFAGNVNVGTGEAITSLTNPGGLFERINAGTISGNVIVNITTDLTAETGTVPLYQQVETGAGGYTILIQPSGGPRLIEGPTNSFSLILLQGSDRVTFSGVAFGGKSLTIRHNNRYGGIAVGFFGDATNNSVVGCVLEGGGEYLSEGVVTISGAGTVNSSNSIIGNTIRGRDDAMSGPVELVSIGGSSNTLIANNELSNYGKHFPGYGITAYGAKDLTISGNTISRTGPLAGSLTAIWLGGSFGTNIISRNIIRDHRTGLFWGIELLDNDGTVSVSENRIYNINNSSCNSCISHAFTGFRLLGNKLTSVVRLSNNMVSFNPVMPSSQSVIYGVNDMRTGGTLELLHNTILISGTTTDFGSWAFRRGLSSTTAVLLQGNIFFNNRTGVGNHFTIGDQSAGAGSWTSDYNLYLGAGEIAESYFDHGADIVGTPVDFTTWKAGSSGRDANSIAGVAGTGPFTSANLFVSPEDLHLSNFGNNPAINAATNTGVLTDFDGQIRPFGSTPDIGADEAEATPAETLAVSGRVTTAGGRGIRNARVTIQGGGLTAPITSMTSAFGYFSFHGLRRDDVYLVAVNAKRYVFSSPSRICNLNDSMTDVNFVAEP